MPHITEHSIKDICPRCEVECLNHVHCSNLGCSRFLVVCTRCDKRQAVEAFMADHQRDCVPTPSYTASYEGLRASAA